MAFDVLSFVMGQQAGKASGGSGGGSSGDGWALTKHFFGSTTMKGGTSDERISVNIGFKPDLLIVLKNDNATTSNSFLYMGYSKRLANAVNMSTALSARNTSSKYILSKSMSFIDDETSNSVIHKADETGFNLGSSWPYSGSYLVFAFGME